MLGVNLLKPRSFLAIIPKVSQTKFHQIRITKSKVIHVQIPVPKWEKTKNWKKYSGLQNGEIRRLLLGAVFRDYKSGQGFQIGAKRFQIETEITNQGKKDFK